MFKGEIPPVHKILFEIVNKKILPRGERIHKASFKNLEMMCALDMDKKVNLPTLIIKHTKRVTSQQSSPYGLAYEYLLLIVFNSYRVPLGMGVRAIRSDKFTNLTLEECDYLLEKPIKKKSSSLMTQMLLDLEAINKEIF